MPKPIVISVRGEPQGIVVPTGVGFRFLAVKLPVFAMEGQVFPSPEAARIAAERLLEPEGAAQELSAA